MTNYKCRQGNDWSALVSRNFYLGDIVGMNTVDGVAHILRCRDDDGEGQHAGGCQPGVGDFIISINVATTTVWRLSLS